MIDPNTLTHNLLTLSNHINKCEHDFKLLPLKNGQTLIKTKNFIEKYFLDLLIPDQTSVHELKNLITKNLTLLCTLEKEHFINEKNGEPTFLFLALQKYNQTLASAIQYPLTKSSAIGNTLQLPIIAIPSLPELLPVQNTFIHHFQKPSNFKNDQPEIFKEKRLFKTYNIRRYPGDLIDHSQEALNIFTNTQLERCVSTFGRVIETVTSLFGFTTTAFQKYHYRKNKETDAAIYASPISPFSLNHHPTSYWLGHATLFLSIPLKSDQGNYTSFNVITDPVEGDLNSFLYPRQTKCARKIEEMPAPHIYLLSHNHLDHYSKETVEKIFMQQPVMIVPKGDGERYLNLAKNLGFSNVPIIELDWWEAKTIEFEKNGEHFHMTITATPARHWSGQGPCGGHESSFLGYVIEGNEKGDIYFAGDTARLNSEHIEKLQKYFNIKWNFQPGGPDEVRKDMESTHQASVDGLWMHFNLMVPKIYKRGMDKEQFITQARDFKTIYMHTMTFKLGNLHLSDTKESIENVLKALMEEGKNFSQLKSYEKQVYNELHIIGKELIFADGETLTPIEIVKILYETIIIPKIGSRLELDTEKNKQSRHLYF